MRRWAFALIVALAAIPTPSSSFIDGLPIDHPAELLLFVLLLTLIASASARDAAWSGADLAGGRAITIAAAAGVALKVWLIAQGAPFGFVACYHGGMPPAAACERSFDNPLRRFSATRIDAGIHFDGAGWGAGFLNSLRFDAIRRDSDIAPAVPFAVEWTSVADVPSAAAVRVRYRGEGTVTIADDQQQLPADYSQTGAARELRIPAGRHRVVIAYRFAPPEPTLTPRTRLSAMMHLDAPPPVRWGATPLDAAAGWAVDLLSIAVFGLLIGGLLRRSPRDAVVAAALAVVGLLMSVLPIGAFGRDKALEVLIVGGCLGWIWSRRPAVPFAAMTLVLLCVLRVWSGTGPAPGETTNRLKANDGLTYESYAHEILDTLSPRAGEPVFTLQVLYRYIRFGERMLFGEGDWLLLAAVLAAMNASYSWLGRRVVGLATRHRALTLIVLATMLWMMNGASGSIEAPMTEYPTWLLLPISVGLMFLGRTRRAWIAAAALMAVATLTRFNQAPAYACLLAAFALAPADARRRIGWGDVFSCAAVMAVLTFGVPLVHNYWYGHSLTVLPTNRYSTLVIDLPPGAFLSSDQRAVWHLFVWKLRLLTHIGAATGTSAFWPLHVLQVALAAVMLAVARHRLRVSPGHVWLAAAPVAALGVHLFYVVHFYYPRHIMFGYLLVGVVALVWIAEDGVAAASPAPLT